MAARTHLLEIFEPEDFSGHNPLHVEGEGLIRGGNGAFYYLLHLNGDGFEIEGEAVSQLLILPRYNEDPIKAAQESSCTVIIERVLPGCELQPGQPFSYNDICHWGVGRIRPNGNGEES
ncbi:hypothetical protein [Thiohalobacter sp.]|uniref:hypothetical protein n=1 Tax=Thiohalobacter sp. TaxID=2025948 RepID=UPI0026309FF1|nr:hypothetical protein [Thiohalobacter sp.]